MSLYPDVNAGHNLANRLVLDDFDAGELGFSVHASMSAAYVRTELEREDVVDVFNVIRDWLARTK